jgi:hypothetical protein
MFTAEEDRNLELLARGLALSHCESVYREALYYLADPSSSSASNGVCSGLNPSPGPYYLSATTSQGYLIGTPIFQPSVGTSSFRSSGAFTNWDSIEDYLEIRGGVC